ncbi:hypothetical protein CLV30_10578 [Haloactinopolyspora alba]|uniref:VOC domain-containing protein n=2 Tax=Haloactinopolyspora alba TaxID=648780 RepID=A0A2P8E574_9ACTN|nr:hypothetical protein CLV30_10578 [Haloactinopolyspora alba]
MSGMTLQVSVPSEARAAARAFYSDLFGRPPQFEPHDDFFEWAPISGQECWLQVVARTPAQPLQNRIRFRVNDLLQATAFLDERDIQHSEPSQLPGVVAFLDFHDPWHNRLGYYEDLAPSGAGTTYPGTSVQDQVLFTQHE